MAEHRYKNEIIAWANGEVIEVWDEGFWYVVSDPDWNSKHVFRVQPKEAEPPREFKKLKHHELRQLINDLVITYNVYSHLGMFREKLLEVVCNHIGHLVEPRPDGSSLGNKR